MMGVKYFEFLNFIPGLSDKLGEFAYWRFGPDKIEICERIDKDPIKELQLHLEEELKYISELFSINQECAIVVIAFIDNYACRKNQECYFTTIYHLASSISFTILEFLKLSKSIRELENKNIIEVKYVDFELYEWIQKVEKNMDYSEFIKESSVMDQKKNYELTETFINKIINL